MKRYRKKRGYGCVILIVLIILFLTLAFLKDNEQNGINSDNYNSSQYNSYNQYSSSESSYSEPLTASEMVAEFAEENGIILITKLGVESLEKST